LADTLATVRFAAVVGMKNGVKIEEFDEDGLVSGAPTEAN